MIYFNLIFFIYFQVIFFLVNYLLGRVWKSIFNRFNLFCHFRFFEYEDEMIFVHSVLLYFHSYFGEDTLSWHQGFLHSRTRL